VFVCEITLQEALLVPAESVIYRPLPKFPAVVRDVSLIAKRNVSFEQVKTAIEGRQIVLLLDVSFVDVYEGKGMADDERSITLRLQYRSDERTLTEEEVESVHQQIIAALEDTFGVKQRT
jgi:phenylalanyl-tRNA synthetase beta chain